MQDIQPIDCNIELHLGRVHRSRIASSLQQPNVALLRDIMQAWYPVCTHACGQHLTIGAVALLLTDEQPIALQLHMAGQSYTIQYLSTKHLVKVP